MGQITVVGSINIDHVMYVERHPHIGETIHGKSVAFHPGGKGANQAVAAAMTGGSVTMIGCLGNDPFAVELRNSLIGKSVDTSCVVNKPTHSGTAFITVSDNGENFIVLSEGANGRLSIDDIAPCMPKIRQADVVLLQNEIAIDVNRYVIDEAFGAGTAVIYNPAPARDIPREWLPKIGTLILNESETESLTNKRISDADSAWEAGALLIDQGVGTVVLTMGEKGSALIDGSGERIFVPAFEVKAVDTTAAGDTFVGAYAVAYTEGMSPRERLVFASAAAAISVTRHGAQSSSPARDEVERFLKVLGRESSVDRGFAQL